MIRTGFICTLLLFFALLGNAQDYWESWEQNYPEIVFEDVRKAEQKHLEETQKGEISGGNFTAIEKYRFPVTYSGDSREMLQDDWDRIASAMDWFLGNHDFLQLYGGEILVEIDGEKYWFPIQNELYSAMMEELKPGDEIMIYAVMVSSLHADDFLFTFLISEFHPVE